MRVGVAFPDLRSDLQTLEDSPNVREALEWLTTVFRHPYVNDILSTADTEKKLVEYLLAEIESGKLGFAEQEKQLQKIDALAPPYRVFDARIQQIRNRLQQDKLYEAQLKQGERKIDQLLSEGDVSGAMRVLFSLQRTPADYERLRRKIDESERNNLPGILTVIHAEASAADRATRPVANAMTLGAEWYEIALGTNRVRLQAYERKVSVSVPPATYTISITNVHKRGFGVFGSAKLVTNAMIKVMPGATNTFTFHDK